MLSAIRSTHRPTTLVARVTTALPDLPHRHRKRHSHLGAPAIVTAVAGLLVALIATAAVIFRDKLTSIVSRGEEGEAEAPDTAEHKLASIMSQLTSIVSRANGGEEQVPAAAEPKLASAPGRGDGGEEQAPATPKE